DIKSKYTYTPNPEELSILDWQDEFYRNAAIQDYNVNVAGGSENTRYVFSGGYMNQEGMAVGTSYDRFSFRTNVESKINDYLSAGLSLAPTYIRRDGAGRANGQDSRSHHVPSFTPASGPGVCYLTHTKTNLRYGWSGSTPSPNYCMKTDI